MFLNTAVFISLHFNDFFFLLISLFNKLPTKDCISLLNVMLHVVYIELTLMSILPSSSLGEGNSVMSALIGSVCSMSKVIKNNLIFIRQFL